MLLPIAIGSSARFSDTRHMKPASVHRTKDTLEFTAWQTKTKDAGDNSRPQPLICPLMSLRIAGGAVPAKVPPLGSVASGTDKPLGDWWDPFLKTTQMRLAE